MRGGRRIGRLNLDGDGQADLATTAASIDAFVDPIESDIGRSIGTR